MRTLLHILTKEHDAAAIEVISAQRALPDCRLEIVDLAAGQPDYTGLLEEIFASDAVAVW
jgi:hypothetical protein